MASLHSSAFSFRSASMEFAAVSSPAIPRAAIASSLKPSRLSRRKNHLRPKILKAPPPYPTPSPVTIAVPFIIHEEETTTHFDSEEEVPLFELPSAGEAIEGGELGTESAVVDESLDLERFSTKSVVKFGAYFVGLFLFQTICAVWFFSSAGNRSGDEKSSDSELGVDGKGQMKGLINGNGRRGFSRGKVSLETDNAGLHLDESSMEKKIEEIRLMAREARMSERKNAKGEGEVEEEVAASKSRVAFEKVIGSRLNKLEKKMNSAKKSLTLPKDVSGPKEVGNGLMFKKKFKFRSPPTETNSQSPKGFGSENRRLATRKNNTHTQEIRKDSIDLESGMKGKASPKEMEITRSKTGPVHNSNQGSPSIEGVYSGTSKEVPRESSQNGSAKSRNRKYISPSMTRQKDDTGRFWWLNLPCVFAVLMRRSSDSEGPEGLFTLKIDLDEDNESLSSFIIGFEDRFDANNFCCLLESFFEDLGDFTADIVPLLRNELQEAVKEKSKNIFVLRKGQLRLYAGQPFPEVESKLMSFIRENQGAYR